MNYRIVVARSGYYYVQRRSISNWNGWSKIGGFFYTRRAAENFLRDYRRERSVSTPRVVAYY